MESGSMELCQENALCSHWRLSEGGMNIKQTPFCQANAVRDVLFMSYILR